MESKILLLSYVDGFREEETHFHVPVSWTCENLLSNLIDPVYPAFLRIKTPDEKDAIFFSRDKVISFALSANIVHYIGDEEDSGESWKHGTETEEN